VKQLELEHARLLRDRPEKAVAAQVRAVVLADLAEHALADLLIRQLLFGDVLMNDVHHELRLVSEAQAVRYRGQAQPLKQRNQRHSRLFFHDLLAFAQPEDIQQRQHGVFEVHGSTPTLFKVHHHFHGDATNIPYNLIFVNRVSEC